MTAPTPSRLPEATPHWLRDIDATLPVTGQYIVHGYLRDLHLIPSDTAAPHFSTTLAALWWTLRRSGYQYLLQHDPVSGLQLVFDPDPTVQDTARRAVDTVLDGATATLGSPVSPEGLIDVVQRVARNPTWRGGIVVDYISQLRVDQEPFPDELRRLMMSALAEVNAGQTFRQPTSPRAAAVPNARFWFVDHPADLPGWMVGGSDGIRQVPLSLPDLSTREAAARLLVGRLPGAPNVEERAEWEALTNTFRDATEGMTLRAMVQTVQLALDSGTPSDRVDDSVRAYRVGLTENKWKQQSLREAIPGAYEALRAKVIGQDRAVRHVSDILIRTTLGLTSAQLGQAGSGPRGVLFFVGPTGVGKTELAKQMTKLLFGDIHAYIRFDMSEFSAEHTEARLIGSPPGYVGHGSGGELTNAVRQRPFSVILFDEIEKAHPRILDKFLQILSDGRLTDGSGATVHFSETVLVFTSNLGVAEAAATLAVEPDADYAAVMTEVIRNEFTDPERFNRPELLGRIGDNIVVFDYITADVALTLATRFIDNVLGRVATETGIDLSMSPAVRDEIIDACTVDTSAGGRGIGMNVESLFVNPLARELLVHTTDRAAVTGYSVVDDETAVHLSWL